jgi:hypothetical protein
MVDIRCAKVRCREAPILAQDRRDVDGEKLPGVEPGGDIG